MTGTNPGAWPDQEENMSEIMTTPELFGQLVSSSPVPVGPLYTAADLAKAREEGRRELADKIRATAILNPTDDDFWYAKRDVYLIGADVLDALLDAKEAGDEVG